MSGKPDSKISYTIPAVPDVLTVAAEARDERDPIAAIQKAVDAHHNKMVGIITALQQQLDAVVPLQAAQSGNVISKVEDKAKAMQFLDSYTKDMTDVRRYDPNVKKGNYIGDVIHLTDHHLIQQVGVQTFVVHDRAVVESERNVVEGERLQIKYNAGKIIVNEAKGSRGQTINAEIKRNISAEKQHALAKSMKAGNEPTGEADQEHEA